MTAEIAALLVGVLPLLGGLNIVTRRARLMRRLNQEVSLIAKAPDGDLRNRLTEISLVTAQSLAALDFISEATTESRRAKRLIGGLMTAAILVVVTAYGLQEIYPSVMSDSDGSPSRVTTTFFAVAYLLIFTAAVQWLKFRLMKEGAEKTALGSLMYYLGLAEFPEADEKDQGGDENRAPRRRAS